ncbi:unnamed protein product [Brassicogethes aeneus]|uniref:Uncharacterized protein n=1 Tax=Brassicogethes aeneus TaxID=1431903 RepID=A0A9P0B204_BRAAE|nr:unnamed protein product [Brassicogethes aeneus]
MQPTWDTIQTNFNSLKDEAVESLKRTSEMAKTQIINVKDETIAKFKALENDTTSETEPIDCVNQEACEKIEHILYTASQSLLLLNEESGDIIKGIMIAMAEYFGGSPTKMERSIDVILGFLGRVALEVIRNLKQAVKDIKRDLEVASKAAKKANKKNKKLLVQMRITPEDIKDNSKTAYAKIDHIIGNIRKALKELEDKLVKNYNTFMIVLDPFDTNTAKDIKKSLQGFVAKTSKHIKKIESEIKSEAKIMKKEVDKAASNAIKNIKNK